MGYSQLLSLLICAVIVSSVYSLMIDSFQEQKETVPVIFDHMETIIAARDYKIEQMAKITKRPVEDFQHPLSISQAEVDAIEADLLQRIDTAEAEAANEPVYTVQEVLAAMEQAEQAGEPLTTEQVMQLLEGL